MEKYEGSISVEFDELPLLELKSVSSSKSATFFERIALASKRRFFSLQKNWEVDLYDISYQADLNGKLTIPKVVDEKPLVFDGASIPMPWLVSLITIGILRPLGVMLTASIIHDFAYRHGYLLISKGGEAPKKIKVERHIADLLFKDIISTVNRMPRIGYIGWFFIRVGWGFVKYNNRHFGGTPPVKEIIIFLILLSLVALLISTFPLMFTFSLLGLYLGIYAITILI